MSFKKLTLHSQKFLRLLSHVHWSNFPVELVILAAKLNFSKYRVTYTEHGAEFHEGKVMLEDIFLRGGQWSILNLDKMMNDLQSYSLITSIPGVDTTLVQMHPLAHGWVKSRIPEQETKLYESAAVLLLALGARSEYTASAQYLASHIAHLSTFWDQLHINNAEAFAFILNSGGAFEGALKLRERVTTELRNQAEPASMVVANSIWALALSYRSVGRSKEAEPLQREALMVMTDILGDRHPKAIAASNNLALTYRDLGQMKEAEVLQEKVLKLRKEVLGELHPDTIMASNNLANTYFTLGRRKEAEALQEKVLKLRKEMLGELHPDTIMASNNLANTYSTLGRREEALALQNEVLKLRKKILGEFHPDTIAASSNLALTYGDLGQLKEAMRLQEEVLKLRKEMLGMRHPDTIRASSNLAFTYRNLGQLKEAVGLQEEVVRLMMEILGEKHPDTISASNNLAITYRELGQLKEAEVLQEKVLKFRKEALGEGHPDTITASNNLADCYLHSGRLRDAEALQVETLRQAQEVFGNEHPNTALSKLTLAEIYELLCKKDDALRLLDAAELIYTKTAGKDTPHYLECQQVRVRVQALPDSLGPLPTPNVSTSIDEASARETT